MAHDEHFVAVRRTADDGLQVNFGNRTHNWVPLALRSTISRAFEYDHILNLWCLDMSLCDGFFQVVPADHRTSVGGDDVSGGKQAETSAMEEIAGILDHFPVSAQDSYMNVQFPLHNDDDSRSRSSSAGGDFSYDLDQDGSSADESSIHAPVPRHHDVLNLRRVSSFAVEDASDCEDEGFWDLRPDWYERARARALSSMPLVQLRPRASAGSSDALGGCLVLRLTSKKRSMLETNAMPKIILIEDLTEGKHILLYRDNHFIGLRCYADGECALSRDHRTCNNIARDVADLCSDRFESLFHLAREVSGLHSVETERLLL